MFGSAGLIELLALWVAQYIVVVARLSFIIFFIPGIGEQVVPARIKLTFLLALSFAFWGLGIVGPVSIFPLPSFAAMIVGETAIGLFLGVSLRMTIWILSIVGTIIAQSVGLSQFMGVALETEAQTITSNLLGLAGTVLLLTANFHVMVFEEFAGMYSEIPVGDFMVLEPSGFIEALFASFGFAASLAWPFVVVGLLYNVSLGFINKAMPQMMVAFVGAPFMVGAGLFLLTLSVVSILTIWFDHLVELIHWL